jgi:hypothetical protein
MLLFSHNRCICSGIALVVGFGVLSGCQFQSISPLQLQIHQSWVDHDGLAPARVDQDVQITCAPPVMWDMLPLHKTMLYAHQQWRSPDRLVGIGVAHLRTPIPLSAQTIIWLAKQQYSSGDSEHGKGGRLIRQWTDALGRAWFEAENDMYHVTGCAMTHGFDAWIVYSGYRVHTRPAPSELVLSAKAADAVLPLVGKPH